MHKNKTIQQPVVIPPSLWLYSGTTRAPRGVRQVRTAENRHSATGPTDLPPSCCPADDRSHEKLCQSIWHVIIMQGFNGLMTYFSHGRFVKTNSQQWSCHLLLIWKMYGNGNTRYNCNPWPSKCPPHVIFAMAPSLKLFRVPNSTNVPSFMLLWKSERFWSLISSLLLHGELDACRVSSLDL